MAAWLALVPWADVIKAAPTIAKAASDLWGSVTHKRSGQLGDSAQSKAETSMSNSITALELRLIKLETSNKQTEAELQELKHQMATSIQLIKELADQNAQLISRVEQNRRHIAWLATGVSLLAVGAVLVAIVF